jgi:hypothetical protein
MQNKSALENDGAQTHSSGRSLEETWAIEGPACGCSLRVCRWPRAAWLAHRLLRVYCAGVCGGSVKLVFGQRTSRADPNVPNGRRCVVFEFKCVCVCVCICKCNKSGRRRLKSFVSTNRKLSRRYPPPRGLAARLELNKTLRGGSDFRRSRECAVERWKISLATHLRPRRSR